MNNEKKLKRSYLDKHSETILQLLLDGKSQAEIARIINVKTATVGYYLRVRGLKAESGRTTLKYREGIKDLVIKEYQLGSSLEILSKKYKIRTEFVSEIIKESSEKYRDRVETRRISQSLNLNLELFEDFESEIASYFLGFIIADGNIRSDSNTLNITLNKNDGYLLKRLQSELEMQHGYTESSVYDKRTNKCYHRAQFMVGSAELISKLNAQNVTSRKSAQEKLPRIDWLNNRHFWRGMIDGDGHLNFTKSATLVFVGSEEIVNGFNAFVESNIDVRTHRKVSGKKYINETLYRVTYTGDDARDIAVLLYENNNVCLNRKENQVKLIKDKDGVYRYTKS